MNSKGSEDKPRPPVPPAPASITVVITCYNQGRFLERSIRSVLQQTQPPRQIIVLDDGSTDITREIAQSFNGVHYVFQENAGPSAARNNALELATEPRILFLDADDWLTPIALQAASAAFENSVVSPAFVHGSYKEVSEDENVISTHVAESADDPFVRLLSSNYVAMFGTVLFDTDLLRKSGGFDTSLSCCVDYDVLLRLAREHPVVAYPEFAANYRRHGENLTRNRLAMLATAFRVIDRHLNVSAKTASQINAAQSGRRLTTRFYTEQVIGDLREAQHRRGLFKALAALVISAARSPRAAWPALLWVFRRRFERAQ